MRRQLVFAAVTVGEPALMVLDEPFAGVDADGRARMRELLSTRMQAGMGLLLAAHDQDVADLEALQARRVDLEPAPESQEAVSP
jgi:ABC-type multidrug transport system ATPase subunit